MSEYWSLVVFTLLGQAAAGIMLLLAFRSGKGLRMTWLALCMLAVAAASSLGHLSRPWLSFYTISNMESSWLSREILGCLALGASMICYIIWQKRWLLWLSAIIGIIFVWAMSMVYTIPTEPAWDTPVTFWRFMASGILLASSLLLLMDEAGFSQTENPQSALMGYVPFVVISAMALCVIFMFMQTGKAGVTANQIVCLTFLTIGGGFGMLALMRLASRLPDPGQRLPGSATPVSAAMLAGIVVCVGLIWLGEIFGRVSFYKSYVWFGM